jgi:hypothetical protein
MMKGLGEKKLYKVGYHSNLDIDGYDFRSDLNRKILSDLSLLDLRIRGLRSLVVDLCLGCLRNLILEG